MIGSRLAWSLPLLWLGCGPSTPLVVDADFASAIFFFDPEAGGPVTALDLSRDQEPLPFVALEGHSVALLYRRPLAEFGLVPGTLTAAGSVTGRALPVADQVQELEGRWQERPLARPAVLAFRYQPLSAERCAELGGCLRSDDPSRCMLPCAAPPEPEAPRFGELPDLPRFDLCPEGWTHTSSGPLAWCEPAPVPSGGCAEGSLALPSAGCVTLDAPCPMGADLWATDLPRSAPILYVASGAAGGSGTTSAPFGSIAEALSAASAGSVIALSRGTHDWSAETFAGEVTLWGACASQTQISGEAQIHGTLALTRISVTASIGVSGPDGAVDLRNTWIRAEGRLAATDLAVVTLTECLMESAEPTAITKGARLELTDTTVRGAGVSAANRGQISMRNSFIDHQGVGVAANGRSEVTLDGVVLHGTRIAPAIYMTGRSVGRVKQLVTRSTSTAIALYSSSLELTAARIEDSKGYGVFALASTATITDLLVRGVSADGLYVAAILGLSGSRIRLERAWLEQLDGAGLRLYDGPSSTMTARNVVIRHTRAKADPFGVVAPTEGALSVGSNLDLQRVWMEEISGIGILVKPHRDGSSVAAETRLQDIVLDTGHSCGVVLGGGQTKLTGERLVLRELLGVGVLIRARDATLNLRDLTVRGSHGMSFDCESTCCAAAGISTSGSPAGARAEQVIQRFRVEDNDETGILIRAATGLQLLDGWVRGHPVGARIVPDAFSTAQVLVGVRYENNQRMIVRGEN